MCLVPGALKIMFPKYNLVFSFAASCNDSNILLALIFCGVIKMNQSPVEDKLANNTWRNIT